MNERDDFVSYARFNFCHVDGAGTWHVDVKALLDFVSVEDTPANREKACGLMIKYSRELHPRAAVVAVQGGGSQN